LTLIKEIALGLLENCCFVKKKIYGQKPTVCLGTNLWPTSVLRGMDNEYPPPPFLLPKMYILNLG
jgi:hypothetical protein